jgi:prevent-host-death family protein
MRVSVQEAKAQLSRLLELVEQGKHVTITRSGKPVAELVRVRAKGLPLGIAEGEPLVSTGDDWWRPMTDDEAEAWIDGK